MSIEVHTDTNNSVVINVDTNPSNADIHIEPTRNAGSPIGTEALYGPRGPKGDKGDKGDSGDSATTYEFVQAVASSTWVITHNLDKYPSVFAVDSSGSVQIPNEITYDSKNQITVEFLSEFSGKAYLN